MLIVDGVEFSAIVKSLTRNFEVVDGEGAGRTLDGVMHRDLIGTYYNYSISFVTDYMSRSKYYQLYELVSSPLEAHSISIAYNDEILTFDAYVTNGSDTLLQEKSPNKRLWGDLSMDFIAMQPKRYAL